MLLSQLYDKRVFLDKGTRRSFYGRLRSAVFSPDGKHLMGFLIRRPDIVGMVRRPEAFLAYDGWDQLDEGLLIRPDKDVLNEAAQKRLKLDWDRCLLWSGMKVRQAHPDELSARSTSRQAASSQKPQQRGRELGRVNDCTFDPETGEVDSFLIHDGALARSLVGTLVIPARKLVGYEDGYMLVDVRREELQMSGGLAGAAGAGAARLEQSLNSTNKAASQAAIHAIDKGSKALGRHLGKSKGMFKAFQEEFKKASH